MFTNKLHFDSNITALNQSFELIHISFEGSTLPYGKIISLVNDLATQAHVVSSAFNNKKDAHLLIKKAGLSGEALTTLKQDNPSVRIAFLPISTNTVECIFFKRLLLNMVAGVLDSGLSNLAGKLLYVVKSTKKSLTVCELTIDKEGCLNLNAVTYRNKKDLFKNIKEDSTLYRKLSNRPVMHLNARTGQLTRATEKEADSSRAFIRKGYGATGSKASIPLLDYSDPSKFSLSKVGILVKVKRHLKKREDYFTVSLGSVVPTRTVAINKSQIFASSSQNFSSVEAKLGARVFLESMVSSLQEVVCDGMASEIKSKLSNTIVACNLWGDVKADDDLVIRIVNTPEYYKKTGETDPYVSSVDHQHMSLVPAEGIANPALKVTLKEAIIKRDLKQGKISQFDLSSIDAEYIFAKPEQVMDEEGDYLFTKWHSMTIAPSGAIEYAIWHNEMNHVAGFVDTPLSLAIEEYGYLLEGDSPDIAPEALVIKPGTQQISVITKTNQIGLPDIDKLDSLFDEFTSELPSVLESPQATAEFLERYHQEMNLTTYLNLSAIGLMAHFHTQLINMKSNALWTRKALNATINTCFRGHTSSDSKKMKHFLLETFTIRLAMPKDTASLREVFAGGFDIHVMAGKNENEELYVVANQVKGYKGSTARACVVRNVRALEGAPLTPELIAMMNVDFVRYGEATVLPFAVKYLNGFIHNLR